MFCEVTWISSSTKGGWVPNFNGVLWEEQGWKRQWSSMQPLYRSKHVFLAYCNCKLSSQPLSHSELCQSSTAWSCFFSGFLGSAKKGDPPISPQLFKVAPLARYQEFSWSLFFWSMNFTAYSGLFCQCAHATGLDCNLSTWPSPVAVAVAANPAPDTPQIHQEHRTIVNSTAGWWKMMLADADHHQERELC